LIIKPLFLLICLNLTIGIEFFAKKIICMDGPHIISLKLKFKIKRSAKPKRNTTQSETSQEIKISKI